MNNVSTDIALITVHALSSVLSLMPWTTCVRCAESPGKAGRRLGTARRSQHGPNPILAKHVSGPGLTATEKHQTKSRCENKTILKREPQNMSSDG